MKEVDQLPTRNDCKRGYIMSENILTGTTLSGQIFMKKKCVRKIFD